MLDSTFLYILVLLWILFLIVSCIVRFRRSKHKQLSSSRDLFSSDEAVSSRAFRDMLLTGELSMEVQRNSAKKFNIKKNGQNFIMLADNKSLLKLCSDLTIDLVY